MKTLFQFSILLLFILSFDDSFSQVEVKDAKDTVIYEMDEIVITGTRTLKKIIDIPYPVNRIDQITVCIRKENGCE